MVYQFQQPLLVNDQHQDFVKNTLVVLIYSIKFQDPKMEIFGDTVLCQATGCSDIPQNKGLT